LNEWVKFIMLYHAPWGSFLPSPPFPPNLQEEEEEEEDEAPPLLMLKTF
jgi:hypothetical protein